MVRSAVMQAALTEASELAGKFASADGLVDVPAIARHLGVVSIEARQMAPDGYLGKGPGGELVIRYRAGNSSQRNRFTIAHEIGHILLAKTQGQDLGSANGQPSQDRREETAVNRIASELVMSERAMLRELTKRELRGETPSWRTIFFLRRLFAVSESALALRILELRGVDAVLFRINIEGRGSNYPCDLSEHSRLKLVNSEEFEADRLWREARRSTKSSVSVWNAGRKSDVRCDGILRAIRSRQGIVKQYWVIGWELHATDAMPRLPGSYAERQWS